MSSIIRPLFDRINCFWRGRQTCDLRFSLQGRYASVLDLRPFRIRNTAFTLPGHALLAGHGTTEEDFIEAAMNEGNKIKARLNNYIENNTLEFGQNHLVILDMEPSYEVRENGQETTTISFSPAQLGSYENKKRPDGSSMLDALIKAYSIRISVAWEVLLDKWPSVQIGLYGVVVPDGKGENDRRFDQRMRGYQRAGELGMYNFVDYLVPVLYTRFGIKDSPRNKAKLHHWVALSTRQAIVYSQKLTRNKGKKIPVAPLLTFWVANSRSLSHGNIILPETIGLQLRILRSYCPVEMIVFWSGRETEAEMESDSDFKFEPLDISRFLDTVAELPLPGCK